MHVTDLRMIFSFTETVFQSLAITQKLPLFSLMSVLCRPWSIYFNTRLFSEGILLTVENWLGDMWSFMLQKNLTLFNWPHKPGSDHLFFQWFQNGTGFGSLAFMWNALIPMYMHPCSLIFWEICLPCYEFYSRKHMDTKRIWSMWGWK